MLQASCKPVAGLLKPSSFSPQAKHSSGPTCEQRLVQKGPGIKYRPRKGCQGYRNLEDFKRVRAIHSGLTLSREVGTDEGRPPEFELAIFHCPGVARHLCWRQTGSWALRRY